MASTQYRSVIELFRGCPFSNNNEHTLEPMSIASKLSWLENNCNYNANDDKFQNLMFVRCDSSTNKGTFRLECLDIRAFEYNYAYINNVNGETFFAYIVGCRYINDAGTSLPSKGVYEFDFELDLLMTNLHSTAQLKPCFVVRQHSATDLLNENYVPEPVAITNTNIRDTIELMAQDNYDLNYPGAAVFGLVDTDNCALLDNVVSGLTLRCFQFNDPFAMSNMKDFLKAHIEDEDIKFGFMIPYSLLNACYNIDWSATDPKSEKAAPLITGKKNAGITIGPMPQTNTVSGYTPKNRKLLTYPYKYVVLSDNNGNNITFRHELWAGRTNEYWNVDFTISGTPTIRVTPMGYANQNLTKENNECVLTITGFPMINWACSAWDRWVATSMIGKIGKKIVDIATWSRDHEIF